MILVLLLLQLIVEGGTGIAVFVRCFADRKGIEEDLKRIHYGDFPRGVLAASSVCSSISSFLMILF